MLETVREIWDFVQTIMGISPMLILPVVLLVEGVAVVTHLKASKSIWRNVALGFICLLAATLVSFVVLDHNNLKSVVNAGITLGSVSALAYQIGKPVFQYLVDRGFQKLRDRFGGNLDNPDF